MSKATSEQPPVDTERAPVKPHVPLLVVASALQGAVLLGIFTLGLGWGGWSYVAALLVSLAGLVAVVLLARRPPPWTWMTLLVPVLSAAVGAGLYEMSTAYVAAYGCSDAQIAAVESIAPPPGVQPEFRGETGNGCIARFSLDMEPSAVVDHYRSQFEDGGWTFVPAQSLGGVAAEKDGVVIDVTAAGEIEGGLVIISVFDQT